MPSPFPGMDPYLEDEKLWPAFHHQLVSCLYQILLPGLIDRYRARVGQRHYIAGTGSSAPASSAEHTEEYLEIRDRKDNRLVTLVDVVSPTNKTTVEGRQAYLNKRTECKAGGTSLVEIDLVLQGQPMLDYSREGLPDWDYAVTVTRSTQPERYEIYTATLQKRLPRFRLPLSPDDRDTVLDLHAAFTRVYDQGAFGARIDYRPDPPGPLSEANRHWLADLLKDRRSALPVTEQAPSGGQDESHDQIARTAYELWQSEGCPHGRDREHWYQAIEQLRRAGRLKP